MIRNFKDKETEKIFDGERSRKLPPDIQQTARRKLRLVAAVVRIEELRLPLGNRFEELKGERKGTYSLRVNDQWRITFTWVDGGPDNVCIEDYHR
jgi:proteic killer suppression protein